MTFRSDKRPLSWLLRQAVVTLLLIGCRSIWEVGATEQNAFETPFDVIHYDAQIEPDIARKTITGAVLIRLGAHEFAHQWWGNMVTNRDWNHFWLNEGMATFMASAYREHRFGRELYLRDIEEYRSTYERIRQAGKDRSLVFPDWNSPTREDRQLVYEKGAYVLHLLREEMGEGLFWIGIRQYTRKYFGKSVVTADFQKAMEQASGKNLGEFFARWVYLTQR